MKVTTVGICGGTGSGKTTLALEIVRRLGDENALLISLDRYYRDLGAMEVGQRSATNFDRPDALDFDALVRDAGRLKSGSPIQAPRYDFATHTRSREADTLEPKKIVLLEGLFVLWSPELRRMLDYSIFLFAPDDIRLARRLARDVTQRGRSAREVIAQYLDTVRPMHQRYIKPQEKFADAVIDTGETVDVDAVVRRILDIAETPQ